MTTEDAANFNEEQFGATYSGYPMNHITAGDIDSGKMIEGLDPKKATIDECQRALLILMDNGILHDQKYCNNESGTNASGTDYHDTEMILKDKGLYVPITAFNLGKLTVGMPPSNVEFFHYHYDNGRSSNTANIKDVATLAMGINALAKTASQKVLDQITAIQAGKSAVLA